MFTLSLGLVVGLVFGWNTKQPAFLAALVEKVKSKLKK